MVGGVGVVIVALLAGAAITLGVLHHSRAHERLAADWYGGGPGHGWAGAGSPGEPFGGQFRGGHRGWAHGGVGDGPGAGELLGSVSSVSGTNLVVTPDGAAAPVTVTTTDRTRVRGAQARALSDLKAGDRVAVRLASDRSAVGVLVVPATTRGTVTAVNGTAVTITQPDGLTQATDTAALPTQPKVGDRVVVTGTANGSTIKAQMLRELPKAS